MPVYSFRPNHRQIKIVLIFKSKYSNKFIYLKYTVKDEERMSTNFDFLKKDKQFRSFSEQAAEAEKSLMISSATSAILARRALELAVRWV